LKRKAKDRLREKLVERLGGDEEEVPADEETGDDKDDKDDKDKVKDALRDLLKQ
jgi:hypothetical protein